jgi:hypothetical protein
MTGMACGADCVCYDFDSGSVLWMLKPTDMSGDFEPGSDGRNRVIYRSVDTRWRAAISSRLAALLPSGMTRSTSVSRFRIA